MPAYGMTCPAPPLSALDLVHLGLPLLLRTPACCDSLLLIFGLTCLEPLLSILDLLSVDSFLSSQGSS